MYACCECCFESIVCLCFPVYAKTGKNNMTLNMKNIIIKNYLCAEFYQELRRQTLIISCFEKECYLNLYVREINPEIQRFTTNYVNSKFPD